MSRDLASLEVLVTAGPTWEPLDPVRIFTSRSSGKMGYALAHAAAQRGARVTLVSGPVALDAPAGVECLEVETALEMRKAVLERGERMDVIVMAAAVADFRPAEVLQGKLGKRSVPEPLQIAMVPNPDILAELGARRRGKRPVLVGFAAETTGNDVALVAAASAKLVEKRCDLVVANEIGHPGAGFRADTNRVLIVSASGGDPQIVGPDAKSAIAERIWDEVAEIVRHGT